MNIVNQDLVDIYKNSDNLSEEKIGVIKSFFDEFDECYSKFIVIAEISARKNNYRNTVLEEDRFFNAFNWNDMVCEQINALRTAFDLPLDFDMEVEELQNLFFNLNDSEVDQFFVYELNVILDEFDKALDRDETFKFEKFLYDVNALLSVYLEVIEYRR